MRLILSCLPLVLVCGCSRQPTSHASDKTDHAADNTGRNARDKSGETVLPTDQSESEADRSLTQDLRKAVMADSALSMNAKNIKIVSSNGKVTLRGVVASEAERKSIVALLQAVPGVGELDDQLEVKTN